MKYPAIVKPEQHEDVRVLVFREEFDKNAIHLEGDAKGKVVDYRVRENLENVTEEYLANTYGEVKSKEHAEFIKLLAENHDMPCGYKVIDDYCKYFYFVNKMLFFASEEMDLGCDYEQITIPLPPECDSADEWPKVGDKVQTSDGAGAVKLLPDSKGYYVISIKDEYYQYQLDELSKPKTPEEELRDEISDLAFNQFNDDSYDLTHNSYYLAEQLISKYNITKKGEGDE